MMTQTLVTQALLGPQVSQAAPVQLLVPQGPQEPIPQEAQARSRVRLAQVAPAGPLVVAVDPQLPAGPRGLAEAARAAAEQAAAEPVGRQALVQRLGPVDLRAQAQWPAPAAQVQPPAQLAQPEQVEPAQRPVQGAPLGQHNVLALKIVQALTTNVSHVPAIWVFAGWHL